LTIDPHLLSRRLCLLSRSSVPALAFVCACSRVRLCLLSRLSVPALAFVCARSRVRLYPLSRSSVPALAFVCARSRVRLCLLSRRLCVRCVCRTCHTYSTVHGWTGFTSSSNTTTRLTNCLQVRVRPAVVRALPATTMAGCLLPGGRSASWWSVCFLVVGLAIVHSVARHRHKGR
jgi:hypothetical protein